MAAPLSVHICGTESEVLKNRVFINYCVFAQKFVTLLIVAMLPLGSISAQNLPLSSSLWPDLSALSPRPIPRSLSSIINSTIARDLDLKHKRDSSSRAIDLTGSGATVVEVRAVTAVKDSHAKSFGWRSALEQAFSFLMIEHGFRIAKEPTTRKELAGPFFADYVESVKGLGGWADGDELYVNYVGHPMEGAVSGFIEVQNDPRGSKMQFGHEGYWKNRLRAMAFTTVYSTQFEIGPISEASIGNVGRDRRKDLPNGGQGFVDLVITPTVGTGWLIAEDIVDRYVIEKLEAKTSNRFLQMMVRGLNPTRSFSNMLRGKVPWHRDTRGGVWRPSPKIAAIQ